MEVREFLEVRVGKDASIGIKSTYTSGDVSFGGFSPPVYLLLSVFVFYTLDVCEEYSSELHISHLIMTNSITLTQL